MLAACPSSGMSPSCPFGPHPTRIPPFARAGEAEGVEGVREGVLGCVGWFWGGQWGIQGEDERIQGLALERIRGVVLEVRGDLGHREGSGMQGGILGMLWECVELFWEGEWDAEVIQGVILKRIQGVVREI